MESSAQPNLHPNDPEHFLKLSKALELLLGRTMRRQDIEVADRLLREYGLGLLEVSLSAIG